MERTKTMRVSEKEYEVFTRYRAAHSDRQEAIMDILHIDHETPKEPGKLYIFKRSKDI